MDFHERLVPLFKSYFEVYDIRRPTDFIYPQIGRPDRPVSASTLDKTARRLFEKMSSYVKNDETHGYHIHSLRHTYATQMVLAGVPIRAIADALGHASVNTTQAYTKLNIRQLREQLTLGHRQMERWWAVLR